MVLVTPLTMVLCRCTGKGTVRLMECILLSPERAVQFHSCPFLVELHLCCSLVGAEAFMPTDLNIFVCQHRSPCGVSNWIFFKWTRAFEQCPADRTS